MDELRQHLDRVVNSGEFAIGDHPTEIAKLPVAHSVAWIAGPGPYTCFQHALGFEESDRIFHLLRTDAFGAKRYDLKFGTEFMLRLIGNGLLQEDEAGRILIYFRDKQPIHAGRLLETGRVLSKWGSGHLWEHGPLEVPGRYGDVDIRRFRLREHADVEPNFEHYYEELKAGR